MAAPPRFRRLSVEDYRQAPDWLSPLLATLNGALEGLVSALSGQLTRSENMRGFVKQLDVTTLSPVESTFPIAFKPDGDMRPTDCWIGRVELAQGSIQPGATSMVWRLNADGTVRIDSISGLSASQRYRIRVVCEQN